MNPKQREKWARIRRLGKLRYMIIYGIVLWGLPVAVLYVFITTFLDNNFSIQQVLQSALLRRLFFAKLFISLTLFPTCGFAVSWWLWDYNEKKYSDE